MKRVGQVALAVVGLIVGAIGVLALREATLSTHRKVTEAARHHDRDRSRDQGH